jgi:hypothetical protein
LFREAAIEHLLCSSQSLISRHIDRLTGVLVVNGRNKVFVYTLGKSAVVRIRLR